LPTISGSQRPRARDTSAPVRPLSLQLDGTPGHIRPHQAALRECLLGSRSRVRVALGAQKVMWLGAGYETGRTFALVSPGSLPGRGDS
jgi:hypothetical protein